MVHHANLASVLKAQQQIFHQVIPFVKEKDKLLLLNFTQNNTELYAQDLDNKESFLMSIDQRLKNSNALYAIGGYAELRDIYSRTTLFGIEGDEPRRLHLGIDIWGHAGTPVFAPLGGTVHSFKFNNAVGDYGATIILEHQLDTILFYTLYGHLSLIDLGRLRIGQFIAVGETFAHFGEEKENGNWPPHLHFQVIQNLEGMKGDYPGVCKFSEKDKYLTNCPDPDIILQLVQYAFHN